MTVFQFGLPLHLYIVWRAMTFSGMSPFFTIWNMLPLILQKNVCK